MFSFFKKIKDNFIPITNDNKSIEPELQDAKAQFNLGVMYENGLEVTHDYKEAFKWFSLSAEQGCADAQNNLGVMFEHGLGGRSRLCTRLALVPYGCRTRGRHRTI